MKRYICKEVPTENGGYLEIEKELIECRDCKFWEADEDERCMYCGEEILPVTEACIGNGFCSRAEPKEKR